MTPRVWASLLCIVLAAGSLALGQAPAASSTAKPQFRITGTLVSSVDGSPVPHGHLTATLVGTGTEQGQRSSLENSFDADDQGRFTIHLPSAGMWNLTAWGRGFVRNGYLGHELYSSGVVLTREHPAMDIQFVLAPEAVIKGMVLDEAGEAVRGAQVSLMRVHPAIPRNMTQASPPFGTRTDDRGMYEFDGLEPGDYTLCVNAQPWYAVAAARGPYHDSDPPLDPSLDVAYPVTWFPGVDDKSAAEALTLKAGDVRDTNIHLRPIPALHLVIDPPASAGDNHNLRYFPVIQRVDSGTNYFLQPTIRTNTQGQIDAGGLTPGLYRVQLMGPGAPNLRRVVYLTDDGSQTISFDDASTEADVTVEFDGVSADAANSLMAALIAPDGQIIATTAPTRAASFNRAGHESADTAKTDGKDAKTKQQVSTLNVPPGKYDIQLLGGQDANDLYLAGITATGAQTSGRHVTLSAGASTLTLHVVKGRAKLAGFVTRTGRPSVGTLVMLVPAALEDPGAIQNVSRDESNTDGSFNIANIIPGQYILIAVEDGWGINWKDKETLNLYLSGGVAVNLAAGSHVTQNISAEQP